MGWWNAGPCKAGQDGAWDWAVTPCAPHERAFNAQRMPLKQEKLQSHVSHSRMNYLHASPMSAQSQRTHREDLGVRVHVHVASLRVVEDSKRVGLLLQQGCTEAGENGGELL